ncbi:sensor histidine kinase [Spirosoma fluminis]
MKYVWFLWLFLGIARAGWAQPGQQPLLVGASRLPSGELSLRDALYRLEDSTGKLTIREVIRRREQGQFTPSVSPTFRQDFGYNTSVQWLYVELESVQKADLMLEIEYANIDQVELFEVRNQRVRSVALTGDRFRFSQRPYVNNNYVFPLRIPAGEKAGYYLRFDRPNAILSFFIRLWPRTVFSHIDRDEYFIWGIYIGVICIVLVVTLVMLLATRDRIYLWYALYLHFMTMHLFSDAGLAFQYLWPDTPQINAYSPVYLYVWLAMVAQITFLQFFIHQTAHNSRVFRWINWFKLVVIGTLLLVVGIQAIELDGRETYLYKLVASATRYFVILILLLTGISLYESVRRSARKQGQQVVRYYVYALIVQSTGFSIVAFINFCQNQGWALPFDVETYVVMGVTVFLDIVFFSYGLAYRYRAFRQTNRALELNLLEARQESQRRVINALEDERRRLAQDLHDDVGATLSTAKGYLSLLSRNEKSPQMLHSQALLDRAAHELRTISHQLMPRHFEQIGLTKAIEQTIRNVVGEHTQVEFVSVGQVKPLDAQSEMLVFSMATDLLRQVQQRPDATEATVQLIYHPDRLNLTVEDNGLNADEGGTASSWRSLRTKAAYLNADLLIDANEQGHSVMVSIPLATP